jgi:hypothetical protein
MAGDAATIGSEITYGLLPSSPTQRRTASAASPASIADPYQLPIAVNPAA